MAGQTTTAASGPTILVGGDGSTLNGGSETDIYVAAGDGVTVNGGTGGNNLNLIGTTDNANVSNASVTYGSNAQGTLTGDGNSVTIGNYTNVNVGGSDNVITAGLYDDNGIYGGSNQLTQSTGTASFTGAGNTAYVNNTLVYLSNYTNINIGGTSNNIMAGQYDYTGVYGGYNTLTQTTGTVSMNGAGNTDYLNYTNVSLGDFTNTNIGGVGNTITAGLYDDVGVYGGYNELTQTTGTASFTGASNTGNLSYTNVTVGGGGDLGLTGGGNNIYALGGSSVQVVGSDTVTAANANLTLTGANTVTATSSNITLGVDSTANIYGSGDNINNPNSANSSYHYYQQSGNSTTYGNGTTDTHYTGNSSAPYASYDDLTGATINTERVTNFANGSHAIEIWDSQGNQPWDKTDAIFDINGTLQFIKTDFNNGSWTSTAFTNPASTENAPYVAANGIQVQDFSAIQVVFNSSGTELGENFYNSDGSIGRQTGGPLPSNYGAFLTTQAAAAGGGQQILSAYTNDNAGALGIFGNTASQIGGLFGNAAAGVASAGNGQTGETQSSVGGSLGSSAGSLGSGSNFSGLGDPDFPSGAVTGIIIVNQGGYGF